MKNKVPHTLQIPVVNPSVDDSFMDLGSQYGDKDLYNISHAPKLGAYPRGIVEESKVTDKYKVLEEILGL